MLKSNELRIGNLFMDKYSKQTFPVLEILRNGNVVFDFETDKIWQAQEIILTEKWLRKFGAESYFTSDPQERQASKAFKFGDIIIHMCNEDVEEFMFESFEFIKIKTVHELQNLYFYLTQQELFIKNKPN